MHVIIEQALMILPTPQFPKELLRTSGSPGICSAAMISKIEEVCELLISRPVAQPASWSTKPQAMQNAFRRSLAFSSVRRPASSKAAFARGTIIRPLDHKFMPRVRRTGSQAFCERIVPNPTGEAPSTPQPCAEHLSMSEAGRLVQSMAF